MRSISIFAATVGILSTCCLSLVVSPQLARSQPPEVPAPLAPPPAMYAGEGGDECAVCGCGRHRRPLPEGKDLSFNCGCNGSYKFPVPPQYTYHWPGMYSQRLMTDYHSPWRFPPIRPFTSDTKTYPSKPSPAAVPATARVERMTR